MAEVSCHAGYQFVSGAIKRKREKGSPKVFEVSLL